MLNTVFCYFALPLEEVERVVLTALLMSLSGESLFDRRSNLKPFLAEQLCFVSEK